MTQLTSRIVCYLGSEEGIVTEAYLDSDTPPHWTWAMGIADTGDNSVKQYKDRPQPLAVAIKASIELIEARYLPPVLQAFGAHALTENQLAAALSFEWRNGTIRTAMWVRDVLAGNMDSGAIDIMNWTNHGTEIARAQRERNLFFKGIWPSPMLCNVQTVAKPSYKPEGSRPTDITAIVQQIMGGS